MRVFSQILIAAALVAAGGTAVWIYRDRTHPPPAVREHGDEHGDKQGDKSHEENPKNEGKEEGDESEGHKPDVSRNDDGEIVVKLDSETQEVAGVVIAHPQPREWRPELVAFGMLQEDPALSFTLRAPLSGIIWAGPDGHWPQMGESVEDGAQIGQIQPRLMPMERLDLKSKLLDARGKVAGLSAKIDAARSSYQSKLALNKDNSVVAARTLEEAEANLKGLEADLTAARETIELLTAAESALASPASSLPLKIDRGGQFVEISAQPGESIESGQPILRVLRFDSLLAKVELPPGQTIDATANTARIIASGHDDSPIEAQRISSAPMTDARAHGQVFLFRLQNPPFALRPGQPVTAELPISGDPVKGVVIPRSAVVRYGDRAWVYVAKGEDEFIRREIDLTTRSGDGWFTGERFTADDYVVVAGAQVLVAEEMRAKGAGEEE